jgi:hypothetical protein
MEPVGAPLRRCLGTVYALEKELARIEALALVIRLMGLENEALSHSKAPTHSRM